MIGKPTKIALLGALACSLTAPMGAQADDAAMRAELQALRNEVAQMRDAQSQNWMNERRAEEVRGLVREVLADADTRSSLLQDGLTAGHDGRFFIGSADGSNRLNIGGLVQFRWIGNHQDNRPHGDSVFSETPGGEDDGGFQNARTRLIFDGVAIDGRFNYYIQLAAERGYFEDEFDFFGFGGGSVRALDVKLGYDLTDNLTIHGGSYKLPFMREFLVNPGHQLAVERSIISTELGFAGRADQIALTYQDENFRVTGSLNDGINSAFSDFDGSRSEFAATVRGDLRLAGQWEQWDDFTAWSGDEMAAFVGGAIHYEVGDGGKLDVFGSSDYETFLWTIDGSVAVDQFSAFASITGVHADNDDFGSYDAYGVVLQGAYNIDDQIQPFVRWEWADYDTSGDDYQAVTFGANYFLARHNAKLSADVVWSYRGEGGYTGGTQVGLIPTSLSPSDEDEIAFRAQFQLMF